MSQNASSSANAKPQASSMTAFHINQIETLSDTQFRESLHQLQTAASTFAAPAPQTAHSKTYLKNLQNWTTTTPPPGKGGSQMTRPTRSRAAKTPAAVAPQPVYSPQVYQPPMQIPAMHATSTVPNPPRAPLPSTPQAYQSTYASRMKTGVSVLVQPTLGSSSATTARTTTRRGGVINYADPGSGDDLPDAGAFDSDDSDFIASGGTRTSIRNTRSRPSGPLGVFSSNASTPRPVAPPKLDKNELDQSYLGAMAPSRFVKPRIIQPTVHEYFSPDSLEGQARRKTSLVPIRVEFETETERIRDCFVWNINEQLLKPETFAKMFCNDLDIPPQWQITVSNQIKAQLEDHEGVASMELGLDGALDIDECPPNGEDVPECRVILEIDVQIANHHLVDYIEWDLLSPLTPEEFSIKLCSELGLSGEAVPLVAHAVHEELIKHKKDAIEWGVIGGEREGGGDESGAGGDKHRDRSGFGLVKDKTGLGLSWGRAPRDGRGPKTLKSVWRDWAEAEEFRTKFEELTAEEVERREIERERATRRLRRETSKFQSSTRRRR